jgi:SGNH domain (fused to AT3 domains)
MNGCLPTLKVNTGVRCLARARSNFDANLALPRVKLVVIGLNWPTAAKKLFNPDGSSITGSADTALVSALDDVIARIKTSGRNVVLIGPVEVPEGDIASILSRELAFGWPQSIPNYVSAKKFSELHGAQITHFDALLGANFLRPDKVLCDEAVCRFVIDGHSVFADSSHISKAALTRFKDGFSPLYDAMKTLK